MQVANDQITDLVKFNFLRRFYFWLLGRGTEEEHKKTLWGRANMAVWNPEIAAYIDQFTNKRTHYALKLAMLAGRVPTGIVGSYLYFKVMSFVCGELLAFRCMWTYIVHFVAAVALRYTWAVLSAMILRHTFPCQMRRPQTFCVIT